MDTKNIWGIIILVGVVALGCLLAFWLRAKSAKVAEITS